MCPEGGKIGWEVEWGRLILSASVCKGCRVRERETLIFPLKILGSMVTGASLSDAIFPRLFGQIWDRQ